VEFFRRRGHDPEVANDLAQDAFLFLLSPRRDGRKHRLAGGYIFNVAKNLQRNMARLSAHVLEAAPGSASLDLIEGVATKPESAQSLSAMRKALREAIEALPPDCALAIRRHYLGEDPNLGPYRGTGQPRSTYYLNCEKGLIECLRYLQAMGFGPEDLNQ